MGQQGRLVISPAPDPLLFQPVFNLQTRYARRLCDIGGRYGEICRESMGGDEQVIWSDGCSLSHQMVAYDAISAVSWSIQWQDLQGGMSFLHIRLYQLC